MNKEAQAESSKKRYEKKAKRCMNDRLGNTQCTEINLPEKTLSYTKLI